MNIDEMKDRIARAEEIQRYTENRCEALEKENAELKEKSKRQSNNYKHDIDMLIEGNKYKNEVCKELAHQANIIQDQLTKARCIIASFVKANTVPDLINIKAEAENFLSEVEK